MAFLGEEEQLREFQDRFKYLYAGVFLGLGLLLARLVYLQILKGDEMRLYSEENRIKRVTIPAPRGMIFDRNRNLLVDNQPAFDLEITPQYLQSAENKDEVIQLLSRVIQIPEKKIRAKLKKARGQPKFIPIKIKNDLTREEVARIETWKLDMPGVAVKMEIQRTNVYGDVASHLLGYIAKVNSRELPRLRKQGKKYGLGDNIGKVGIEKQMEEILRGQDGQEIVEVDALGRKMRKRTSGVFSHAKSRPTIPGRNLVLTIDQDLQLAATKAFGEKVGALVAIQPKTGEILAMVSRPSFDPTEFSRGISPDLWKSLLDNEHRPLRDKTIQDHYPPGSVFKALTAITALEEGVVTKNTRFNCPGKIRVGNRFYHCHRKGGHGDVNLIAALQKSCDVYFYRVAQKLKSVNQIAAWGFKLGLGKKTGIDLPREVPGLIPTEEWKQRRFKQPWTPGESLTVAIGQSFVLTTPIQLANLYAGLANGGKIYKPFFIKSIESHEGEVIQEFAPELLIDADISEDTLKYVNEGLWKVVNTPKGTAYWQRLPGLDFSGKTGTSQVVRLSAEKLFSKCEELPYRFRHHALFAGFAPIDDPTIAVAVVAEHACKSGSGAAAIVKEVVKTYLNKYFPDQFREKILAARRKEAWLYKKKQEAAAAAAAAASPPETEPSRAADPAPQVQEEDEDQDREFR